MGEPCPAPLRVAMRSPLPFPCVPDRPYKILLVQVGTLSFSHPSFGVPDLFIYLFSHTHGVAERGRGERRDRGRRDKGKNDEKGATARWHEGCSENRRETAKRDRKRRTPKGDG